MALRQSCERIGKHALIAHQRYAHARQFKRANKTLRKLRTFLGRVERDIARRIKNDEGLRDVFRRPLYLAERVREQRHKQRGKKVYSLHAPEVECIGKGKAHRPYEFGVKVSVATTLHASKGGQFVTHVKALAGAPYDGHTLAVVIHRWSGRSAPRSSASSLIAAIAVTMRRKRTSSGCSSRARDGASPSRSNANCDAVPLSSLSSGI